MGEAVTISRKGDKAMFAKGRLMIVYTLIIFMTIAAVDALILNVISVQGSERTIAYFTYGNIAATWCPQTYQTDSIPDINNIPKPRGRVLR